MAYSNQPLSSIEALSQVAHDMFGGESSINSEGSSRSYTYATEAQPYGPLSQNYPSTTGTAPNASQSSISGVHTDQFRHQPGMQGNVKLEPLLDWDDRSAHTSVEGGMIELADSARQVSRRVSENVDVKNTPITHHESSRSNSDSQRRDSIPMVGKSEDSPVQTEDTAQPAWSELKTKAGKERKRLPLACIACRRKKIRCSGEKPACKHCLRSRIPCVYKVTTRKATPRTDYMAMLDKRLKRMEERIIKAVPKAESNDEEILERAALKPAVVKDVGGKLTLGKKRSAKEAFSDGLDAWAKENVASSDAQLAAAIPRHDSSEESLMTAGSKSLPSFEIQEYLVEVFFDYVYGQAYYLLHKPTLVRKLKSGTVPPVLILAICAIASRFADHPEIRDEPSFLRGESWAAEARRISVSRYDEPNITILTVLLILGLHEFGSCRGGRSWMFGGMAMRMAVALQLHKELDNDPLGQNGNGELSCTDREVRRRLMWSCFLMDRFNSSGTGRPLFMSEDNIQVQLPIREDFFQMGIMGPTENIEGNVPNKITSETSGLTNPSQNTGAAGYVLRIICFWGHVIQYFNLGGKEKDPEPLWSPKSRFASLKQGLEQFKEDLPENLQYNEINLKSHASRRVANQFLFLHISYHQVILFLHRFAIPSGPGVAPPQEMPKDFINKSGRIALEAASQISSLIRDSHGHRLVAPFVGYCAYLSSTIHIFGLFQRNSQLRVTSKQNLETNISYLMQTKRYWGVFHYMTGNLKEIYRQYEGTTQQDEQQEGRPPQLSPGALQYGDWFDRYPHGLSKSNEEGPASPNADRKDADILLHNDSDLQSVDKLFASVPTPVDTDKRRGHKRLAVRHSATTSASGTAKVTSPAVNSQSATPEKSQTVKSRRAGNAQSRKGKRSADSKSVSSPPLPLAMAEPSQDQSDAGNQEPPSSFAETPMTFSQPQQNYQPLQHEIQQDPQSLNFQQLPPPPPPPPQQMQPLLQQPQSMPGSFIPPAPQSLQNSIVPPISQQGMLPEIDRQLVYDAYMDSDVAHMMNNNNLQPQQLADQQQQLRSELNDPNEQIAADVQSSWTQSGGANGGGGMNTLNGDGFGVGDLDMRNDPMSNGAWFIPFNTEPPWY